MIRVRPGVNLYEGISHTLVRLSCVGSSGSIAAVLAHSEFAQRGSMPEKIAVDGRVDPLGVVPEKIPFDVPYGPPISLDRAQAAINAAVTEAKKRRWKMNIAVVDSGG